jgi:hypothetical protein
MLLHSCCCIFIYELSGFYIIQKGVQNLLKMNLQNCFIKEKGKHLFFSLIPWIWPAGPTSRPLASVGPRGRCPSFPSAWPSWPTLALFLGRPTGQRALPPWPLTRWVAPSVADAWAYHPPSPTSRREGRRPSFFMPPP